MPIDRSKASDALATHRDDHLTAVGDVPHVPAQMVMKLAHADLTLEFILWRHSIQYRHHNAALLLDVDQGGTAARRGSPT